MGRDYKTIKEDQKLPKAKLHNPDGKFAKGNPGGPGKACLYKDKIKYHDLLLKATTPEKFQKVAEKLLAQAQDGEPWAIKELLDRLMGKPKQFIEADLSSTNVDPQVIIGQVSILLGLDKEDDVIEIEPKQVESKDE